VHSSFQDTNRRWNEQKRSEMSATASVVIMKCGRSRRTLDLAAAAAPASGCGGTTGGGGAASPTNLQVQSPSPFLAPRS
jgi:hypothetical protein